VCVIDDANIYTFKTKMQVNAQNKCVKIYI